MASGQTINYNLNQWEAGDKVLREEFNADNEKIDGVLAGLESSKAEQSALVALEGSILRAVVGSYTGTGAYGEANPCTLDFTNTLGRAPKLVVIRGSGGRYLGLFLIQGMVQSENHFTNSYITGTSNLVNWSGNQVTWYAGSAEGQMNGSGTVYLYFAIG